MAIYASEDKFTFVDWWPSWRTICIRQRAADWERVIIDRADWPAIRDAIDKAIKDKEGKK